MKGMLYSFQSPSRRKAIATASSASEIPKPLLPITFPPKGDCAPPKIKVASDIGLPITFPPKGDCDFTASGFPSVCDSFQSPSRRKAIATSINSSIMRRLPLPITFPPKGDCDIVIRVEGDVGRASNHLPAERRLRRGGGDDGAADGPSNHLPAERRLRPKIKVAFDIRDDFQSPSRRKAGRLIFMAVWGRLAVNLSKER